jgi:hypothetical protein
LHTSLLLMLVCCRFISKYCSLNVCDNSSFITGTLCQTLSIVWVIFDIEDEMALLPFSDDWLFIMLKLFDLLLLSSVA